MWRTFARAPGIQAAFGARTIYKEGKFGPFGRRSKCIPCDSIMASHRSRSRLAALSVYWVTAVYQFSDRGQTELTTSSRPPKPTVLIPTTDLVNQYTVRNWYTAQTVGGSACFWHPTIKVPEVFGTGLIETPLICNPYCLNLREPKQKEHRRGLTTTRSAPPMSVAFKPPAVRSART
jgi:hypothetical protein